MEKYKLGAYTGIVHKMVTWLLSLCLAVIVVAYIRGRYSEKAAHSSQAEASDSVAASEEVSADSTGSNGEYADECGDVRSPGPCNAGETHTSDPRFDVIPELPDVPSSGADSSDQPAGDLCPKNEVITAPIRKPTLSPVKRGGRPREDTHKVDQERTINFGSGAPKLELVCWKRQREWVVAVEVPDEQSAGRVVSVLQNGELLLEDDAEPGRWLVKAMTGEIIVDISHGDDKIISRMMFGENRHLTFRLSGDGLSQGRLVKRTSSGSYLVVVPADLERHEELAGVAPAVPEPVCVEGYLL